MALINHDLPENKHFRPLYAAQTISSLQGKPAAPYPANRDFSRKSKEI